MAAVFEWGEELPQLDGERIFLRQMTESDAGDVFSIYGDDEVIRYWSSPAHESVGESRALILDTVRQFRARKMFEWGAALVQHDRVIGTFTLVNLDVLHRRAEVGYALSREFWGAGYATEGLELLIAFAFGPLNLHRLEADVHPDNAGSLRVLEKQGFRREGYLRERWHHLGRVEDAVYLGLLRPEWIKLKNLE